MRIKKKVHFLFIAIIIAFTFALSGCYSLGDATKDDDDYCDTYSVWLIDEKSSSHSYDMEDFYNKEAVNDFKTIMTEDDRSEYTYILIQTEKDLNIGEVAVYVDSSVRAQVKVQAFILDEDDIPTKVYTGEGCEYKKEDCNEPDPATALSEITFTVSGIKDKWHDMFLSSWKHDDGTVSTRYAIKEGQYIALRIVNNCYDPELTRVPLRLTSILIYAE